MIAAILLAPKIASVVFCIVGTILFLFGIFCSCSAKKKNIKINKKIIPLGLLIVLLGITISQ